MEEVKILHIQAIRLVSHSIDRALVWPKQFLGKGSARWFAVAFPHSVIQGRHSLSVQCAGDNSPTRIERHGGIFNVHQPVLTDGSTGLTSSQWTMHMHGHLAAACETPGWQFTAGSRFKPRLDSSRLSCEAKIHKQYSKRLHNMI